MNEPEDVLPFPQFLGDHEYMRDFWPGDEYAVVGTSSWVTPYEKDGQQFTARVIGRVHEVLRTGASQSIMVLTKPTAPDAAQDLFTDAYAIADHIILVDREDVSRIIVMETHWCAGNALFVSLNNRTERAESMRAGDLVTCEVLLRREERQAPWSTTSCRLYSRVYRMLALSVGVQILT